MTTPRLSPAMRTMLRNAITGVPLAKGLCGGPHKHDQTRLALVARGLLDRDAKPTGTGQSVFAPAQLPRAREAAPC